MLTHHTLVLLVHLLNLDHLLGHFAYNIVIDIILSIFVSVFLFCMAVLDELCKAFVIEVGECQEASRYRDALGGLHTIVLG